MNVIEDVSMTAEPQSTSLAPVDNVDHQAPVVDQLSDMVESQWKISPTPELYKVDASRARLPKERHPGLYNSVESQGEQQQPDHAMNGTKSESLAPEGVPGFPDFPDQWSGGSNTGDDGEGWVFWKRIGSKESYKAQRRQMAEVLQEGHIRRLRVQRLQREAVNRAGTCKKALKTGNNNNKKIKAHKMDRRRKLLQQLREKRQMNALRRSLKKLKCT